MAFVAVGDYARVDGDALHGYTAALGLDYFRSLAFLVANDFRCRTWLGDAYFLLQTAPGNEASAGQEQFTSGRGLPLRERTSVKQGNIK